ncbi:phospholipid carrier-dependent glycosyltransferase [Microcoleus sp. ZQ-A2]|nr:phospholipid carrier-dependent glycosyltransferase [Microcoleus sp. FACHB-1]
MTWSKKLSNSSIPWFGLGMSAIFICSVALRFWGLGRFNTLVFDEVYYAKFANNYLTGTHFFNAHPPLSQYIIAIGMWIGTHLPIGQDNLNSLTGSLRTSWSYRWLNALTGSFIPLVVGALAYALNRRKSFALIAALFAATDGLFLVESRYALNNVYLVILGLLGQLFFLKALGQKQRRWLNLALSGIFFGASACIKWNGLWFLMGVYMIWAAAWVMQWMRWLLKRARERSKKFLPPHAGFREDTEVSPLQDSEGVRTPLQNLTQLKLVQFVWNLAIIPVLTYSLLWIPHLQMNPEPGFWQAQHDILTFHEKIGDGPKVHPYCSRWFSWLLMWRPVAYFYQTARNPIEQVPAYPPLPAGTGKYVYDVHAIGNPFLWWLSTAAILWLLCRLAQRFIAGDGWKFSLTSSTWIALFLVLGWLANLLPWVKVTRCTFLYHYMGASVFSGLALAWLVDRWLRSDQTQYKSASLTILCVVVAAFVFWLPIYLGLPLPMPNYQLRMWFRSWI